MPHKQKITEIHAHISNQELKTIRNPADEFLIKLNILHNTSQSRMYCVIHDIREINATLNMHLR